MSCAVYSHFRNDKRRGVARLIALATSLMLVGLSTVHAQDRAFQFGLIGDTGYSTEGIEGFKRLLASINAADLAFVVHVGDFENDGRAYTRNPSAGPMPCTDESFRAVYDSFQGVKHPIILTPGDNDWTDCHGVDTRQFEPLELLAKVRASDPRVGYATVYRTLKLLTECGVANERRFGDGLTRYELADETTHHDHLICTGCEKIVEFENEEIERLQEEVATRNGFTIKTHRLELYGLCARCRD